MNSIHTTAWARLGFISYFLIAGYFLPGQSDTIRGTINHDAEYLIREVFLAGECFEVFNIEMSGVPGQAGVFSNGMASIGLNAGIVLSNGNVSDISGPNTESDTSTDYGRPGNDPDLQLLSQLEGDVGDLGQADLIILEFDFVPTISNASFDFVFASEEYCEFALSTFYDTFGFFVSGPGINGPFTNNAQNVAVVPNTTSPITARNVNFFNNSAYYVNNTPASFGQSCTLGQAPASPNLIAFDGYTVPLTANFAVEPCQTYHLKLVVADRSADASWDSAVFLEASSFAAGLTSNLTSTVSGPSTGENAGLEGCGEAILIFSRGDSLITNDLVVTFEILPTSTAIEGVDFSEIPDSVIIPAGVFADTLTVQLFADNDPEGLEFFTIKLDNPCKCSQGELSFSIIEPPPLRADITGRQEICLSEAIELAVTPTSGNGLINYAWENGDRDSIYNVAPTVTRLHTVTLTDECGQEEIIETEVIVNAPTATLSGDITLCDGLPADSLTVYLAGADVYSFDIIGTTSIINFTGINADSLRIPVNSTSVFEIRNLTGDGCFGLAAGVASAVEVDVEIDLVLDTISCFAGNDGSATLRPRGGDGSYTYEWPHAPALTGNTATGLTNTSYFALARDSRGCQDTISFMMPQASELVLTIDTVRALADCRSGGSLALNINGGTAPYAINWSNSDTTVLVENLPAMTYQVTVLDEHGCQQTAEAGIGDQTTPPPLPVVAPPAVLDCGQSSVDIDARGSDQSPELRYHWLDTNGDSIALADPLLWSTAMAGTYTLIVTNTLTGCQESTTTEVRTNTSNLQVSIAAVDPSIDCNTTSVALTATEASGNSLNWQWSSPAGLIDGDTGSTNINARAAGWYYLRGDAPGSSCFGLDSILITVDTITPQLQLNGEGVLSCTRPTAELSVTPPAMGSYNYAWQSDGILQGDPTTATITAAAAGTYELTVTDAGNGCSSSVNFVVTDSRSNVAVTPISDQLLNCSTPSIDLQAQASGGASFNFYWINTAGDTLARDANYTLTTGAELTVLAVNPDNGCRGSTDFSVQLDTLAPQANIPLPDTLTCAVTQINLRNSIIDSDWEARWEDELGNLISTGNWTQSISSEGDYTLIVTNTINGCRDTARATVARINNPPVATLNEPDTLDCTSSQVALEVQVTTAGNYEYLWTGPLNGLAGPTNAVTAIGTRAGDYAVAITDSQTGCAATYSLTVRENSSEPVINPIADTSLTCVRTRIELVGSSPSPGNLSFRWLDDQGNELSDSETIEITTPGNYELEVTNTDNGCSSQSSFTVVDNSDLPIVEAGPPATIGCNEEDATLRGEEGPNNYQTRWLNSLGEVLLTDSWQLTTNQPGLYTLEVTNPANSCVNTDTVRVLQDQDIPVVQVVDSQLDCFSGTASVNLAGSSTGPQISYALFTEEGVLVSTSTDPDLSVSTAGSYQLVLTNNGNGCSAAANFNVSVDLPVIQDIVISSPQCLNDRGLLEVLTIEGGTAPYLYALDEGEYSLAAAFGDLAAGTYELVVQDANGCEDRQEVRIDSPGSVEIILEPQYEIKLGEPLRLNAQVNRDTNTLTSVGWEPAELLSCADCLSPTVLSSSSQFFELTVVDANGCVGVARTLVLIDERVPVYVPNAFSPNRDGSNDRFIIFGDPAQIGEIIDLNIFDRWGTLVFEQENIAPNDESQAWDGTFNGRVLNSGVYVYLLRVQLLNGELVTYQGEVLLMK